MTRFRCDRCGRELADDTAFCPYCGADRRPAVPTAPVEVPPTRPPRVAEPAPAPSEARVSPAPAPVAATVPASPPLPQREPSPPPKKKRRGCATPLLVVLLAILAGLSWCTLRRLPSGGAPVVAGSVAVQRLHVSRRWRPVRLPGDAPADARFAVSSDTALRVRAGGRTYAVRPGRPLRLPDDVGDSFDVRAADYVSNEDAARAKVALNTLRGG